MTREEREKAIDLLDNLRGMIEDNQGNDYDFALKKGIEALKHEQGSDEMTVEEYRHRMMQAFLDTDCDELVALCVFPTEKEFEYLKWVLEKYFKQEPSDDCVSRNAVLDLVNSDWEYEGLEVPIDSLPSIKPAHKKSRWILIDEESNTWQCLRCKELGKDDYWQLNSGTPADNKMDYCPYCGAEMESGEDNCLD